MRYVDRLVVLTIAHRADRRGTIDPDDHGESVVAILARACGLSRGGTLASLKRLELTGWLKVERRTRPDGGKAASAYRLTIPRSASHRPPNRQVLPTKDSSDA